MRNTLLVSSALVMILGKDILAQTVSIGVKAGLPLTDSIATQASHGHDESRPYLIGPSIEVTLPANFAIEANALYRRVGGTINYGLFTEPFSFLNRTRGNSWEFPVMGKYYFQPREAGWQPFVGTGWALRTVGFRSEGTSLTTDQSGAKNSSSFRNDYRSELAVGAVVAAGLRFRAGRLAVLPEVRYTRWGASHNSLPRNEAAIFLGITF